MQKDLVDVASHPHDSCDVPEFVYTFDNGKGKKCKLTCLLTIPCQTSIHEYACRLMNAFNIPCYLEAELTSALTSCITKETDKWHKINASNAIAGIQNGSVDVDKLVNSWANAFKEEHIEYSRTEKITNEEVFSEMYHTMVHSPILDTLLSLEHSYAVHVGALVQRRDRDLHQLQLKQSQEMEGTVNRVGLSTTDEQVNELAVKQLEDIQLMESKWESEISALRETQKREFQDWIVKVHEEYHTSEGNMSFLPTKAEIDIALPEESESWLANQNRLEESFTIHLGAQLKQMHNLRLLSADVLDLCHFKPIKTQNTVPQRLQTAMSLYSNNLCGLVTLVDSRVNSYTGIKREFSRVCQTSTEFHFLSLEDQLEIVRELVHKVSHWRSSNTVADNGWIVSKSLNHQESCSSPQVATLKPGDVYITRHSNLAEVHVVFHVVTDDSIRSTDISSRHPVIMALRNVLKVACLCDVTTITLPLLLVHDMAEEMTMSWCLKRAEVIYKCVKGFMIEMASWGGSENRTVQFLVPKGISDDLFSNLSTMLPSIFRMSNPLKVKL